MARTKNSFEFKKQIVMDYEQKKGGCTYLGRKYGVHPEMVRKWVKNYQIFGWDGIKK